MCTEAKGGRIFSQTCIIKKGDVRGESSFSRDASVKAARGELTGSQVAGERARARLCKSCQQAKSFMMCQALFVRSDRSWLFVAHLDGCQGFRSTMAPTQERKKATLGQLGLSWHVELAQLLILLRPCAFRRLCWLSN